MKRFFLLFISILCISCNPKEKYIGTWVFSDSTSVFDNDAPMKLIFSKDSIKITRFDFNPLNKYAFILQDDNIVIENKPIKTAFNKDTLIINDRLKFFKDDSGKIFEEIGLTDPKIEINLPEIEPKNIIKYPKFLTSTYIRFGKRHDNGEFALELNDKYSKFTDLIGFLSNTRNDRYDNKQKHYLFIDKDSKMKDLEKIFLIMSSINEKDILLVNNSNFQIKDTLAFNYKNQVLRTRISPTEEWDYLNSIINNKNNIIPFIHQTHNYMYYGELSHYPNVISLIKNECYFNTKKINKSDLSQLLKETIKNKNYILSLYDLESNYYHFLELQITIRSVYNSIREQNSLKRYNLTLNDLTKNQLDSIKFETPIKHIWSYSIPHFEYIYDIDGFLGMKMKPLDSILPKKHFTY
ncbi:hypothetical protein [uncultured Lacinutrix sp.]|uniref:hypothetical protein n=1 Tax=uncultured Lacinutrix sp. TaxID=574032 RepID=UPI0026188EB3|nr:hypothetical protein [uncultured Lacinutrix sp.]